MAQGTSVIDHVMKMRNLFLDLKNLGTSFKLNYKTDVIFYSLPQEIYGSFIVNYNMNKLTVELPELGNMLEEVEAASKKQKQRARANKKQQTLLSTFLATLMATVVVSKATLSKCFSNKSFVLRSELRSYLASKKKFMSPEEAQAVTNELDAVGGDSLMLSFEDFPMLMEREGGDDDLKRGFQMFAGKRSGSITLDDLQRIFSCLGNKMSNEECKSIIKAFDLNGDGVIDFAEFQKMMA
ncbi:probable calcium-binding protein CML26 [Telopea speciosissima]|uniref:probable calcium-binding protein CML26 n=1 Tax=Telopea speciosissima TaxID=54955 RepID=UPI001CC49435|nr:probable calcium-binding protein CML26 [Telopea speciosissima]